MVDFQEAVVECQLVDLGYNGADFTWNNMRKSRANIQERLDRAMVSMSWLDWTEHFSVRLPETLQSFLFVIFFSYNGRHIQRYSSSSASSFYGSGNGLSARSKTPSRGRSDSVFYGTPTPVDFASADELIGEQLAGISSPRRDCMYADVDKIVQPATAYPFGKIWFSGDMDYSHEPGQCNMNDKSFPNSRWDWFTHAYGKVGFDSLFFGRIDYQDRTKRKNEKNLEVVWRGSKTLGSSAQIFAGAFPENYEPPSGFYFEVNDESAIVQDDINLFYYNVQERVNDFVTAAVSQANITRTNHRMWTMGTDFKYQYAHTLFRQLDKLIHYVNIVSLIIVVNLLLASATTEN
ncbi:hypothetical protein HHK36_006592 [Tetracentron sinense]|uniref:Glycoside hydrolase family 38 N-terminal domain-containing protein n=1 Tax=Tetracentron sinense TaxID=13715 RepID=A0A834ZHH5_TETSI|nr:hypothetical protein HHK36_006592 [Tetracentron sinense]